MPPSAPPTQESVDFNAFVAFPPSNLTEEGSQPSQAQELIAVNDESTSELRPSQSPPYCTAVSGHADGLLHGVGAEGVGDGEAGDQVMPNSSALEDGVRHTASPMFIASLPVDVEELGGEGVDDSAVEDENELPVLIDDDATRLGDMSKARDGESGRNGMWDEIPDSEGVSEISSPVKGVAVVNNNVKERASLSFDGCAPTLTTAEESFPGSSSPSGLTVQASAEGVPWAALVGTDTLGEAQAASGIFQSRHQETKQTEVSQPVSATEDEASERLIEDSDAASPDSVAESEEPLSHSQEVNVAGEGLPVQDKHVDNVDTSTEDPNSTSDISNLLNGQESMPTTEAAISSGPSSNLDIASESAKHQTSEDSDFVIETSTPGSRKRSLPVDDVDDPLEAIQISKNHDIDRRSIRNTGVADETAAAHDTREQKKSIEARPSRLQQVDPEHNKTGKSLQQYPTTLSESPRQLLRASFKIPTRSTTSPNARLSEDPQKNDELMAELKAMKIVRIHDLVINRKLIISSGFDKSTQRCTRR